MFRHAGESGAKIFDGVKVKNIEFEVSNAVPTEQDLPNPGKPIAATYEVKATKETGRVAFDYVVDASGRAGILSTQYLKNRRFNQGLKNVASWGYWEGCGVYSPGTARENSPFFEALRGMYNLETLLLGDRTYVANMGWRYLRREWLGLVYPTPQRDYLRGHRHEPGYGDGQKETGWPRHYGALSRESEARTIRG